MTPHRWTRVDTPIGTFAAVSDLESRTLLAGFLSGHPRMDRAVAALSEDGLLSREPDLRVADALRAYFAGDLSALEQLEVAAPGTPFQTSVWSALREIPCGQTCSYSDIAVRVGSPRAVRAVGAANGKNPVSLIVPCHRVIGADGTLTGYAGGLERKRWLLAHESREAPSGVQRTLF